MLSAIQAKQSTISQMPKIRGRNLERQTSKPKGKSHNPQKISAMNSPWLCNRKNSIASASRCGLSNTVKNSPPRNRITAAMLFSAFRKQIAADTKTKLTISIAHVLFTLLSRRYNAMASEMKITCPVKSPKIDNRHNILAHETMWRLSIFGDLTGQVIFISLAIALYRLLSNVNKTWAMLMVSFVLVSAAICFLNALNNIAAVILFRGGEFLTVFDRPQRDALAMLFLRLHDQGEFIAEIFWGLWLFPFGLLVCRSRFLPRILGIWLIVDCFAWIALSITAQFFPQYYQTAFAWLQPAFFAELVMMLWLLFRGANVKALPAEVV